MSAPTANGRAHLCKGFQLSLPTPALCCLLILVKVEHRGSQRQFEPSRPSGMYAVLMEVFCTIGGVRDLVCLNECGDIQRVLPSLVFYLR